MLIVLGIIIAAILVGAGLYFYGPDTLRETPTQGASALGADQPTDVPFAVIAEGAQASMSERKNFAAYTHEDFVRLWAMAYGENAPAMPVVNFDSSYVIGVFAGQKSSGGHGIRVDSVTDGSSLRTVAITLTRPASDCVVTQALTSPFQIISVPFSDRDLARTEKDVEVACQ